uniref:Glycosyltransferase 2-like domain-containing protein n=1 Tax=Oryza brachyantha TaxID=4533 RepID=J3N1X0_ORYBR
MPPSAGLQATESLPAAKKDAFVATGDEASPEAETKLAAGGERPLVLTTRISTTTIRLYRFVIFVRIGIFVLFFMWRITYAARLISSTTDGGNMRKKAAAFRTLSIAGELWFAFMWVLDQLPKTMPVRRAVDVAALADESLLPKMDVFVTTADPDKEPPLATANTVLSILAADYPAGKMTCYVSDDGGAELTHEAVVEAARFAVLWVPFCRKHSVEPRSPEVYFNAGEAGATKGRVVARGSYKGRAWPELVRDRRRVRREYEEMRIRIDALQARRRSPASGTRLWRRHGTGDDHAGAVQVLIDSAGRGAQLGVVEGSKLIDLTSVDGHLPALVYVRREKRRGRAHHRKAGAMNALLRASAVLSNAPFILNLDCDHYVNNSEALRASVALHSEPEQSHVDDEDAIAAARALVSCSYEDRTAWGEDVGWVYGTRVAYLNTTVYPFTSLFLMAYCLLPAVPLIAGCTPDAVEDMPPTATYVAFLAALMLTLAAVAVLETRWSGIPLWEWWRNEQFWMVSATGAYLAAVAQVALKVAAGKEISFKLTTKSSPLAGTGAGAGKDDPYAELYAVRWTVLMVPTSAVLAVNVASMAAAWADTGGRRWWDWDSTAAVAALRVAFNAWVVVHLYPFALGLMGRRSKALRPILFLLGVVAYLAVRFLYLVLQFHSD